jgi:valyl-tRNA synthetase
MLMTGFDIIFFWVARMIMFGKKFMGDVPFRDVYIHGLVKDADGAKMSKSKGNGIDPLHVIEGADVTALEGPIRDARPARMNEMLKELHQEFPEGFPGVGADALRRLKFVAIQSQQDNKNLIRLLRISTLTKYAAETHGRYSSLTETFQCVCSSG